MQRKDPKITNNETIHILTFRAHFQISSLLFLSSGNHKMIYKKGGRIRTYRRPSPDLLGWMRLRYPAPNLISPTPLLVVPLPIMGNPGPAAPT
ncbi:unnamed protein product [Withania somnifera]